MILDFLETKKITPNEWDKCFIDYFFNNQNIVVLNSENVNMIRSITLYITFLIHTQKDKLIYVFADTFEKTLLIKKSIYLLNRKFHKYLVSETEKEIIYPNNIKIRFNKIVSTFVKKDNTNIDYCFFVDTAYAQYKYYKGMFLTLKKSLTQTTKIATCSIPNGLNFFAKLFKDAEIEKNSLKPLRLYYWQNKRYDNFWVKKKILETNEEYFSEKYNLQFLLKKGVKIFFKDKI